MNEPVNENSAGEIGPPGYLQWFGHLSAVLFNTGFALLSIVTLVGIVFITRPNFVMHDIHPDLWLPLLIVMAPAQIYAQFLSWRTIAAGEVPSGPNIARRQYPFPFGTRTIVAFVWHCNFVIELGIIVSFSKPHPGKPPPDRIVILVIVALAFWFAFAANVYLALAVRTFTNDWNLLRRLWRYRYCVDLLTAVFAAAYYNR